MSQTAPKLLAAATLGIAAIAVAVILATRGADGYTLDAVFEQANGLVAGAEVQAAGLKVGSVKRIELGSDGLPHIRMRVSGDYRMRRGGRAAIRFFSVSGEVNRYVELHAGVRRAVAVDGATIIAARTDQPVEIDEVLATLDPQTRADVHTLLRRLDETTTGRGADIEKTLRFSARALRETASLVDEVRGDGRALRSLLRDGRIVTGALASDPAALGATADELAGLLSTTAARQRELARGGANLPGGLRSPRLALDRARAAVERPARAGRRRPAGRRQPRPLRTRAASRRSPPPCRRSPTPRARARRAPATAVARRPAEDGQAGARAAGPRCCARATRCSTRCAPGSPTSSRFFANWADFTSNYDANGHARPGGPRLPARADERRSARRTRRRATCAAPFLRTPGVLEGEPWTDFRDSFVAGSAP